MREMSRVLRGLDGLNVVGADIVEVAPAYDDRSGGTALAAAQVIYEILSNMVQSGLCGQDANECPKGIKTEL